MRREVACTHARARGPPDGAPLPPRRTKHADGSARPRRDPAVRSFAPGPQEETDYDQDLHTRRPSAGTHRCAAGTPGRHSTLAASVELLMRNARRLRALLLLRVPTSALNVDSSSDHS